MPVKDVIGIRRPERTPELVLVPVEHGKTLTIEFDARRYAVGRLDVDAS